jgi:hypothetical protein
MEVPIYENTSSEGIRKALSGFGRFSSIDIEEKNDAIKGKILIFREVGLLESLHRLIFKSKEDLEISRKNSQKFLYEFSKNRPDIQKLLGSSIVEKEYWTVGEFREKLKIKTDFVRREKNNDLLQIPKSLNSKVAVIDAKSSGIKADFLIQWTMGPTKVYEDSGEVDGPKKVTKEIESRLLDPIVEDERKTLFIIHEDNPNDAELRAAYKAALSNASGHVVIEPIYDVPISDIEEKNPEYPKEYIQKICSDQSLRILLEEINHALIKNPHIKNVTIARGGTPDSRFLSRVVGQKAILYEQIRHAAENQEQNLTPMPDSLRLIKDEMEDRLQVKVSELQDVDFLETKYQGVSLCCAEPEMLAADVAFLDFSSIERGATVLKKSGLGQLQRVWNLWRDRGSVASEEVGNILTNTKKRWNIHAFELPACELPANKVFAMESVRGANDTSDSAKNFFITHLKNLEGRVVIEVRGSGTLRTGLFDALDELSREPGGLGFECVLAFAYTRTDTWFPDDLLPK